MVAAAPEPEELVSSLREPQPVAAVRCIKNAIIGNSRRKLTFVRLGAVELLVGLLYGDDPALLVQAAAALGSFAASDDGAAAVIEHGGVAALLAALQRQEEAVVQAAVRSLKMIYSKCAAAPKDEALAPEPLARLVSLLPAPRGSLAECAALVLACCAEGEARQAAVLGAGGVPPLAALLRSPCRAKQEASLAALAALTDGSAPAAAAVAAEPGVLPRLLWCLKHGGSPRAQFLACAAVSHLAPHLPRGCAHTRQALQHAVLPVLVRLLGSTPPPERAPAALCALVSGVPELQAAAADADAVARLAAVLRDGAASPALKEGCLRALAALCSEREEARRQLVGCRVLPQVAGALAERCARVRTAACHCMRSLSRSAKLLRGSLGEVEVTAPLLELTAAEDADVAAAAAAALANIAMDCAPVKERLLAAGGAGRFAALARSLHCTLRLHGLWGLSNLAYMSGADVKAAIMAEVPWSQALQLLADDEPLVREKAVLLLRNLVYNSPADIDAALAWSGGALLAAAQSALERCPPPGEAAAAGGGGGSGTAPQPLRQHAVYVVVNVASGGPPHKAAVMASGWPAQLAGPLAADPDERVREAAVWALINLSWRRDGDDAACAGRVAALAALGAERTLRALAASDASQAVRERAETALAQLAPAAPRARGSPGGGGGGPAGGEAMSEEEGEGPELIAVDPYDDEEDDEELEEGHDVNILM